MATTDPLGGPEELAAEAQNGTAQKTLEIDVEVAQSVVNYLARQPYGEVFELIHALQASGRAGVTDG